jgi:pilus assembly protein CpaC
MFLSALLSLSFAAPNNPPPPEPTPAPVIELPSEKERQIDISVGQSVIRTEKYRVARIIVSDPEIAEPVALGENQYQLRAKSIGRTDLWIWYRGAEDKPVAYQIVVGNNQIIDIRRRIEATASGSAPRVYNIQDRLVIEGAVDDLETLERIAAIARIYDENFVNLMTVRGDNQVQLRVIFAEVNRTGLREMGLSSLVTIRGGGGIWSGEMDTPISPAGVFSILGGASTALADVTALLSVLEQNNLSRTLAQPTLVALSGQQADFLSGGELPVPVGQVNGYISIDYKEYGIKVSFIPTVLSGDVIDMRAYVEVSDIDPTNGIQLVGVQVPAVSTRKAESHLRLRNGMTFAMAGLLSERTTASRSQIPILGDIPLIGLAFRYIKHEREEVELVVFVTPYLVRPMAPSEVPAPPGTTEDYTPSDLDLFLLGKITGNSAARTAEPTGPFGLVR